MAGVKQPRPARARPAGLEPLARPEVAARRLDASRVVLGRRIGAGAHATVYAADLLPAAGAGGGDGGGDGGGAGAAEAAQGRGRLVAKCLDRAGPDLLGQVGWVGAGGWVGMKGLG